MSIALARVPVGVWSELLLAVRDDSARQVTNQALLDPLNVVGPRVGAAAEPCVDAVDDVALGDLLRNDLTTRFNSVDRPGRELHMC